MSSNHPWYILLVRGGREEKVIAQIQKEASKSDVSKKIIEFYFIPHSTKPKNLLSGCIFYRGQLDQSLVQLFYSVPGVIRFLDHSQGEESLPFPLSPQKNAEFLDLLKKIKKGGVNFNQDKVQESVFQIGDRIKVIKGPFADCQGKISDIDEKKKLATINIDFLGRLTPTEILITDCVKEGG